jgi:CBS-domain-containing membrane protein
MRTVRDVMATEVFTVAEDTDFRGIVEALVDRSVSALPVVDGEDHLVGIVSESDLLHKEEFSESEYSPPLRARLRTRLGAGGSLRDKAEARDAQGLMTRRVVTVSPESSVALAARSMERHGVNRLPVLNSEGRLVGIVGRRDLLSVFLQRDEAIATETRKEISRATKPILVSESDVSVRDGVVRLTGSVEHRSGAEELVRRVRRLEGVVAVDSELRWRIDDVVPEYVQGRAGRPQ